MNQEIKNKKSQKGFTLVELIVVIAILGILAAVAVPNYMNYQRRSRINTDASSASEIVRAARSRYIETEDLSTTLPEDVKDMVPVSGGSFSLDTSTTDEFKVSWTASSDKVGSTYATTYTYTEGADLPTVKVPAPTK